MPEIQRSDRTASARNARRRLSRQQEARKTTAKWRRRRLPMRELAYRPEQAAIYADVQVRARKPVEALNSSRKICARTRSHRCKSMALRLAISSAERPSNRYRSLIAEGSRAGCRCAGAALSHAASENSTAPIGALTHL